MNPPGRRLAVRVTPAALRHVRAGHPWVFADAITSISHEGLAGDLAVIFDQERAFAAIGLYDPESPIRIKVLHAGRPQTIDDSWWRSRISGAGARRAELASLAAAGITTAYRVVHGENDGLPGVVLDRYTDTYVLKLYSAALLPHLDAITAAIVDDLRPASLILRTSRAMRRKALPGAVDGSVLAGSAPDGPVLFRENGLTFEADVIRGQKTGHFLDQRDNRALVRGLASGRTVLDVFSCTGGFAVHAAAGGATHVHRVDLSAAAIEAGRRNIDHNADLAPVQACSDTATVGDAFEVMDALRSGGECFDLVVVDPPSFAQKATDVAGALRAYGRLTALAVQLVSPGGTLVQASCSSRVSADQFHATVADASRQAGAHLDISLRTAHTADHPIGFPEGAYLKAVVATVRKTAPRSSVRRAARR